MARIDPTIDPADLHALREGRALHLDHYGENRLAFAQISGNRMTQRLVALNGRAQGQTYEVMDASGRSISHRGLSGQRPQLGV